MIDRIKPVEQPLELIQRGVHSSIAHCMDLVTVTGVHGGEDHRDVEHFGRRHAGRHDAGLVVARVLQPEAIERLENGPRLGAKRGCLDRFPRGAKPLGALVQRCRGDAQREVVEAELFLPNVPRRFAPAGCRQCEVDAQQTLRVGKRVRGDGFIRATLFDAKRSNHRSTVSARSGDPSWRTCPTGDIERAIRIHTRVRVDRVAPND